MTSIKTVFKRSFSMTLLPMGFVYSKQINSFIRLVNGEIFQFISLKNMHMRLPGYKEFTIDAGIRTIYAEAFGKDYLLSCAVPLLDLAGFDGDRNLFNELFSLSYDEDSMEQAVTFALKKTLEIVIPKLDEINDYNSCIAFYKKYRPNKIKFAQNFREDSLLLVKANNHDDLMPEFQKALDLELKMNKRDGVVVDYEKKYRGFYQCVVEEIAGSRDKVYNDPELYARALAEMERRKTANLEVIRSYGLDV